MAPAGRGGGDAARKKEEEEAHKYEQATSAKELLDRIGETIQKQVKREAADFRNYLKGDLSQATFEKKPQSQQAPAKPCDLNHEYHTIVTTGHGRENPCKDNPDVRFSDTEGAQCNRSKIKDNKSKEGACAPYRRLHLCDHNLENINDYVHITNHTLLADVCQAAKFEGESLTHYREEHQKIYPDSSFQICTVLARSFADIGDIIRGRDLYIRNRKENERLENNLKRIFKKIHEDVTTSTSGKKSDSALKTRYGGDENYFQLREDWWDANRKEVWDAMTCDAVSGSNYFRQTCLGNSSTLKNCRCFADVDPPTYFDYVPQYLRWFEEWGEEFCKKRKKQLQNAKEQCRKGDNGEDIYCDLKGFDCQRTKYKNSFFVEDTDCKKCSVACDNFMNWIEDQHKEFLKQRNKYQTEIKKYKNGESRAGGRERRNTSTTKYDGYEKHFYEILERNDVGGLNKFLEKLNNETDCQKFDIKEGTIDFKTVDVVGSASGSSSGGDGINSDSNKSNKTFAPTEYCDRCPECGVEKTNNDGNDKWKAIQEDCSKENTKTFNRTGTTEIPRLTPEQGKKGILGKYSKLCSSGKNGDQIETWECHYEKKNEEDKSGESGGSNICEKKKTEQNTKGHDVTSYYSIFYGSIIDMLKESIEWRDKLKKCIENDSQQCVNKQCKGNCECYKRWVEGKTEEWAGITTHFGKQEDLLHDIEDATDREQFFEYYVNQEFLEDMQEAKGDRNVIKKIEELLKKKEEGVGDMTKAKTIIDLFLNEEEGFVTECLQKNPKECPPPEDPSPARSENFEEGPSPRADDEDDEEDDEEDDNVEGEEEKGSSNTEEVVEETVAEVTPKAEVKPCEIVKELFTRGNFDDACNLKYGKTAPTNWKCIPTTKTNSDGSKDGVRGPPGEKTTTSSDSSSSGAICVPPRRRRMYIGPLIKWADEATKNTGVSSEAAGSGTSSEKSTEGEVQATQLQDVEGKTPSQPSDKLRNAFIQSAAVETFFLWDRYKKIKEKEAEEKQRRDQESNGLGGLGLSPELQPRLIPGGVNEMAAAVGAGLPLGPEDSSTVLRELQSHVVSMSSGSSTGGNTIFDEKDFNNRASSTPQRTRLQITGGLTPSLPTSDSDDDNNPEKQLKEGKIPNDFLKQMFYTLGDYRDILFGDTDIVVKALSEEDQKAMKTINDKIEQLLPKNGTPRPPKPDTQEKNSGQSRHTWWSQHAQHIWNGMICALTYTDSQEKDGKPQKVDGLYEKLFENATKNPKNDNDYENVKLDNSDDTKARTGNDQPTKLKNFVKRPPFFRYLQEWGDDFCRERAKRLEQIKHECRNIDKPGRQYCSGDGYDCTDYGALRHKNMFAQLDCKDCHIQCRKYRKWIDLKFQEYHKQEKTYGGERGKLTNGNCSGDNTKFCTEIKAKNTAPDFLAALKHCKDGHNASHEDQDEKDNKIDFDNPEKTFSRSTYCKACPPNEVKCNGGSRRGATSGCTPDNENKWDTVFSGITGNGTTITVQIIDRRAPYMKDGSKQSLFKDSYLFKGVRTQEWECRFKEENKDVCKLKNFNNDIDLNDYTTFKVFLEYWLENFLDGYYLLKKKNKIDLCTQEEKNTCDEETKKNCACVKEWVAQKTTEWGEIKKHFNKGQYANGDNIKSKVKMFLETFIPQIALTKGKEKISDLSTFLKFYGCSDTDSSQKDIIDCLIENLSKEATSCETLNPSDQTSPTCDNTPTLVEDTDTLDDIHPDDIEKPGVCNTVDIPVEPPSLTCVEKIAKELREEAEKNAKTYDPSLKGTVLDFKSECNMVKKENNGGGVSGEKSCKFEDTYKKSVETLKETCKGNGKERFNIEQQWKCVKIKKIGKDLCIPPRREHMCLEDLNYVGRYYISDSNDLLKKVQKAAKREGDDIIRNLLKQNSCDEHRICDAMKYSFADLGDIIRGRDLWNKNSKQIGLQTRLQYAFINIHDKLEKDKSKYENDKPKYLQLRSDWWDTNRKEIWKAMTCNAPDAAKLLKKNENGNTTTTSLKVNCGHDFDPPDYDYIPQPFRWMQEWSESSCKLLNKELENFKNECEDCKNNGITCGGDKNGEKCKKCKKQCENYEKLINKWKNQFDKYKEAYKEIYNNDTNNKANISSEPYFKNFLENLKTQCNEKDSADKYLDEASHCTKSKFNNDSDSNNNKDDYAFKDPPQGFEQACKCDAPDPLEECPDNNKHVTVCTNLFPTKLCVSKSFNNDYDIWTSSFVQKSSGKYAGVLVPPRRGQLCVKNIRLRSIRTKEDFQKKLIEAAYNEAFFLSEKYKDKEKALHAMKYSFADYGDIVKGTDLISTVTLDKLKTKLDEIFKTNDGNVSSENRGKWWTNNKRQVWHAMLCGYQKAGGGKIEAEDCTLPDDETDQFLRWFKEWSEHFCARQQKLYEEIQKKCESAKCDSINGIMVPEDCQESCTQYRDYVTRKIQEFRLLNKQYNMNFKEKLAPDKYAPEYFKAKCNSKCECLSKYIDIEKQWKNMYDSFHDNELKKKCICTKIRPKIPPKIKKTEDENVPVVPKQEEDQIKPASPPPPKSDDILPPQPSDNTSDILQTTIPFGIVLALTSIAFLFMKKKTKSPVDFFSVLEIPQNDYGMPTFKSSNRYIPYASDRYKGKTYIYMEGDTDEEKYSFMSDTSDITSSESEYEELDINDIYPYTSPKYKTLIEVVLEPSKRDIQNDIPSGDTPNNKLTDNEWNQLKKDFITNILQSEQNDIPNNNIGANIPLNTQPNTLYFDKPEEKPFIMSIHDRNLLSGDEISYNINGDVPINTNISTTTNNTTNDSTSGKNDSYSGIDLINDSLNSGNQPIDIYDELLKRKENELFGTNHVKHTSTHNVAKPTNSDPVMNQLELFHKWLDRHRSMCEKWDTNNKVDILNHLKEKWENETHSGNKTSGNITPTSDIPSGKLSDIPSGKLSDIPSGNKTLNTDVSIQIDMDDDPKNTNEFTYVDSNPNLTLPSNPNLVENNINPVDENPPIPNQVQIEMSVKNTQMMEEKYTIGDVWDI
ncbi:erythrocyte membrane protein 1, EMP1 [Plasmodium reichenowi]|uniref:Erythrocyte membrane protein 1, EMP1 n=1 Tax=Plasmodium reichenowi TaxID=5854 RepID=A0A060RM43_PLARE|nr:erythrocyte membrane protein 1, EMP1 [Plasmodium reichenowi]